MRKDTVDRGSGLLHSRRSILAAGVACGVPALAAENPGAGVASDQIPRRKLGRTGVEITRLGMGGSLPDYTPRLLDFVYRCGVRYFDTGEVYFGHKVEGILGDWVRRSGHRKEVFIVTKSRSHDLKGFERRLEQGLSRTGLETIDMFFLHGLEDPDIALDRDGHWRKLKEQLVRAGKIRFMGFSTHAPMPQRIACLNNAAKGGWVDALMVACDPMLIRATPELNKALDACAKADIGLICMKSSRGLGRFVDQPQGARKAFEKLGMSPHVAMLAGMWSDERFTAVCSEMQNFQNIEENTKAARTFKKPFDAAQWKLFEEAASGLTRATCPGCDNSCRMAAGSRTDFCSITRYLAYFRESGNRGRARELYAELAPEARDWRSADLKAAAQACRGRVDFEALLPLAERLLG
ncbi:MAG: hypothetical protein AMXMBFR13_13090 [Phycisphaerae bacterium]